MKKHFSINLLLFITFLMPNNFAVATTEKLDGFFNRLKKGTQCLINNTPCKPEDKKAVWQATAAIAGALTIATIATAAGIAGYTQRAKINEWLAKFKSTESTESPIPPVEQPITQPVSSTQEPISTIQPTPTQVPQPTKQEIEQKQSQEKQQRLSDLKEREQEAIRKGDTQALQQIYRQQDEESLKVTTELAREISKQKLSSQQQNEIKSSIQSQATQEAQQETKNRLLTQAVNNIDLPAVKFLVDQGAQNIESSSDPMETTLGAIYDRNMEDRPLKDKLTDDQIRDYIEGKAKLIRK